LLLLVYDVTNERVSIKQIADGEGLN